MSLLKLFLLDSHRTNMLMFVSECGRLLVLVKLRVVRGVLTDFRWISLASMCCLPGISGRCLEAGLNSAAELNIFQKFDRVRQRNRRLSIFISLGSVLFLF